MFNIKNSSLLLSLSCVLNFSESYAMQQMPSERIAPPGTCSAQNHKYSSQHFIRISYTGPGSKYLDTPNLSVIDPTTKMIDTRCTIDNLNLNQIRLFTAEKPYQTNGNVVGPFVFKANSFYFDPKNPSNDEVICQSHNGMSQINIRNQNGDILTAVKLNLRIINRSDPQCSIEVAYSPIPHSFTGVNSPSLIDFTMIKNACTQTGYPLRPNQEQDLKDAWNNYRNNKDQFFLALNDLVAKKKILGRHAGAIKKLWEK